MWDLRFQKYVRNFFSLLPNDNSGGSDDGHYHYHNHQRFFPRVHVLKLLQYFQCCGPGSVAGIATGYGLDSPGIESRWGARFSAPVQTGPGAHPASCTMGTVSFPGVKSGRGVTLTPHPLLVPWSRQVRAISLLPLWAVRPVQSFSTCTRVHFTFTSTSGSQFVTGL
jgi:hypothetical protein